MVQGFFSPLPNKPRNNQDEKLPQCGACGLKKTCKSPMMPVTGNGRRKVLVVAEAPGKIEDERNEQLVGPAGLFLREVLDEIGVDLDGDCWKTNALICRPPNNENPTTEQIEYCRPNLTKTLDEFDPDVVIPLGDAAIRCVIGPYWKEDTGSVSKWAGWQIPHIKTNKWICPTYHPSYVMRQKESNAREYPVLRLWFKKHLESAFSLQGKPWQNQPNYVDDVEVLYDVEQAARRIRAFVSEGGASSFDLETNRLKPDNDNAQIVSCAICWKGKQTIAFPWVGDAITAVREYVVSPHPKIGANNKFEERWIRKVLGVEINNWVWDCMLSAHHLDCRPDITSVKFQAFVRLGVDLWNHSVESLLTSTDADGLNRVKEIPLSELLLYNGLDALYEYLVAGSQRKEMLSGQSHS